MLLAIRDPESFAQPDSKRRVPTLAECRLFTAGTEGGDLVERCLFTGRVLVSPVLPLSESRSTLGTDCVHSDSSLTSLCLSANIPSSSRTYLGNLNLAKPLYDMYRLLFHISPPCLPQSLHARSRTRSTHSSNGGTTFKNTDAEHIMGTSCEGAESP